MGNNTSLYSLSRHSKQFGSSASIDVKKVGYKNKNMMKWNVLYTIDGSKSELGVKCFLDKEEKVCKVIFDLTGDIWGGGWIKFWVSKDETNFLKLTHSGFSGIRPEITIQMNNKTTTNTRGCITESTAYVYCNGRKGGLLVTELKKKSGDEKPYMLTVAHYYAVNNEDHIFRVFKESVGLSVIAKVQMSTNMGLDITVEQGPVQHPASALFYMCDQVGETGIWKPTSCPHCAYAVACGTSSQSESEDNDNYFQPPRYHGPGHNVLNNSRSAFLGPLNGGYNNIRGGNFPTHIHNYSNIDSSRAGPGPRPGV